MTVIIALVLVFASVGVYLLWRARPAPLPWKAVGAEKIDTPSFDLADEGSRKAFEILESGTDVRFRGSLARGCWTHPVETETYVLTTDGQVDAAEAWVPRRVVVRLGVGGTTLHERYPPGRRPEISRRSLDGTEAERFRDLLVNGGYADLPPWGPREGFCHRSTVTLESCVHGRYYGVVRYCELRGEEIPSLDELAMAIEQFALGRAPTDPYSQADVVVDAGGSQE